MRSIFRAVAAAAATVVTAAVMTVGSTATAQAADGPPWAGCSYGAACIYPENQDPPTTKTHEFVAYGAYNLSNQYGMHWILNNQYDNAKVDLCYGYNGTNCFHTLQGGSGIRIDFTPINSVVLRP